MKKALVLASASLLLLGAGCIPTPQSLIQGAVENKINSELKGDATVDLDNNGITINNDEEGTSASFGENVQLPDNFPKEIPVLDGAKILGVAVTLKEGSWISLTTDKTVEEAASWYDAKLLAAGWTVSGAYSARGMATKMYENGSLNLAVIVSAGEDGGPTGVMVTESVVN
ncbi:MAG: hypothetical protein WC813_04270 [Patescibacteria group bacterium]|jgi:hypothetical protein